MIKWSDIAIDLKNNGIKYRINASYECYFKDKKSLFLKIKSKITLIDKRVYYLYFRSESDMIWVKLKYHDIFDSVYI